MYMNILKRHILYTIASNNVFSEIEKSDDIDIFFEWEDTDFLFNSKRYNFQKFIRF